jgi:UDP-GlcNAc:undecaprenyl-phosphate GlcNAc-1-phosphate transferase
MLDFNVDWNVIFCFLDSLWVGHDQLSITLPTLLAIALLAAYLSFLIFRIYRGMWKYVGFSDLIRYAETVLLAVVVTYAGVRLIYPQQAYTLDVFFLYGIFLYLGLAGSRSSFQLFERFSYRQRKLTEMVQILFYGAGDAGEIALRWILRNPQMGLTPIGFLDDDPYLWGQHIHDVEVLGSTAKLTELHHTRKIDEVIVTSNLLLSTQAGVELLATCVRMASRLC